MPWATMEANVRGTYNLLEAVRRVGSQVAALVVASSDKAYGESATLPYTEAHPLAGRNIYDASKSAADLLTSAYGASFDLPVGDRPLRQHLRRRRPELGAHRARHDPGSCCAARRRSSAATARSGATTCTSTTRSPATSRSARR